MRARVETTADDAPLSSFARAHTPPYIRRPTRNPEDLHD